MIGRGRCVGRRRRVGRSRGDAHTCALLGVRARPRRDSSANSGSKRSSGARGIGERHLEVADDAARAGAHHQHPGRQEHRLVDRVGDEQRGEALALEQAEQLVVQPFAGDLVERAERLVEQEDLRLEHQRAGQRGAHLHAAGELLRVLLLEPVQADEVRSRRRHGACRSAPVDAFELGEQLDVALHGAPLQQRGVLEHVAEAGCGRRRPTARVPW